MATFKSLTQTETNEHHRRIFEIIAAHESEAEETQDGYGEIALDAGELNEIRDEMYAGVRDNLTMDGDIQTATELRQSMKLNVKEGLEKYVQDQRALQNLPKGPGIVQDGYQNPVSGIGTYIDPGMQTQSFVPVSITPQEATAYYANGGVPARIIDKKAGCLLLDGLKFKCDDLSPEDLAVLEAYADKCGFTEAYRDGVTQALIFGGAAVYPVLKGDNPLSFQKSKKQLLESPELPERDFIKYWVTADRWNCVFIPEYNITAQDYLYARSIFIPLGGVRVNTGRVAMIRPRRLPFWGAINQMGWSTSEFESWIKDYESYEIMKMSLPIMAQQMSLMYHQFPADGMIIENGPDYARQFFKQNEEEMRTWSMLRPKAINSVGEIKILERTYSGFQQLVQEARLALCSGAAIPESVLFAERPSGLASDNKDDMELKQTEAIRLLFNNVAPSFQNAIELLVLSCFGKNSEQAKHARKVQIAPDNGVILSDMEKAQLGQSFTTILGQLVSVGAPLETAVDLAHKFVPSAEIDDDIMEKLTAGGEAAGMDQEMWDQMNGGRGNPLASLMNPGQNQQQPANPLNGQM